MPADLNYVSAIVYSLSYVQLDGLLNNDFLNSLMHINVVMFSYYVTQPAV